MPDVIRDDLAFLDRIHCYIPGWEVPKMRMEFFTDHYGFVVDYLAEAMRALRKVPITRRVIDKLFQPGLPPQCPGPKGRSQNRVRPHEDHVPEWRRPRPTKCRKYYQLAIEGRRRVKEQLKKMGAFEYYHTSFSYMEKESGEEHFVGAPEMGGRDLISSDPLAPGSVYSASGQCEKEP
jgi:ATP-dependent Lon protease